MKRYRLARQIGLTSTKKVKRPGSKYYHGGADASKGKKKKWWYEFICSICRKINKVEPKRKAKCVCKKKD